MNFISESWPLSTASASPANDGLPKFSDDLNRLLCAAVVNRQFCRKLLVSPTAAAAAGYDGYDFVLTDRELQVLAMVRATKLADFAQQLIQLLGRSEPFGSEQPVAVPAATLDDVHRRLL